MNVAEYPENTSNQKGHRESHKPPIWLFWRARRYVVIVYLFFGLANSYAMRANMSIAIVAMTRYENVTLENATVFMEEISSWEYLTDEELLKELEIGLSDIEYSDREDENDLDRHREFEWDTVLQGYILSSFFYGYLAGNLISAYLALDISGKLIMAIGLGTASALTLLAPIIANVNVYVFLVARVVTGLFEGLISPSLNQFWSNWTPLRERNRLVSISLSGNYFGMVVSSSLSSLVCSAFGWESIFYLFGVLGALWTVLWLIFVANSPDVDPRITKEELNYIAVSLKSATYEKTGKIPWLAVLTSLPVWALMFAVGGEYWGFNTLLAYMPKFMNYILNFDLNKTGLMSSLPYVLVVIILQVSSYVYDFVTKNELMSLTRLRKLSIATGFLFQFVFLLLAVHILSPISSTICLLLAVGMGGVALSTLAVNVLDLSPRLAPLISGMINILAIIPGIISPTITGYIITDETDVYQWRIVFYITAAFYLFGLMFYTIFGSGELQAWDNPEFSSSKEKYGIVR